MAISPWYDLWTHAYRRAQHRVIARYRPLVSVLIPAWNEEVGILSTVRSLLNSTYKNLEIIVVNDGSTDNSDKLMRDFTRNYNKRIGIRKSIRRAPSIIYHYQQNGGKGAALNKAYNLSSGDILLSIDADCVVDESAVENFVKHFANPKVMAAVGNVKIGNIKNVVGIVQYLEFLFSFYFKRAESLMNTIYIIGGAAGAFRREVFETIGVYSTTNITEDIELSIRIQAAGMKIAYASDALVYTEGASDIRGLLKQRLRWKRGRFETFIQHRSLFFSEQKHHNKLLTHFMLPLALFGDIQLMFEVVFLLFLYLYSWLTQDFSSFISGIIVVSSMFFVQMFFDTKHTHKNKLGKLPFYLLSPIGWLLFYVSTIVEYNALFKSIMSFVTGKEVKWQKWQRSGALDQST